MVCLTPEPKPLDLAVSAVFYDIAQEMYLNLKDHNTRKDLKRSFCLILKALGRNSALVLFANLHEGRFYSTPFLGCLFDFGTPPPPTPEPLLSPSHFFFFLVNIRN